MINKIIFFNDSLIRIKKRIIKIKKKRIAYKSNKYNNNAKSTRKINKNHIYLLCS